MVNNAYMNFLLEGYTKNFPLSKQKGVWFALYEAVSNSLQAISIRNEKEKIDGIVDITIQRDSETLDVINKKETDIKNIIIKDNGIGFTDNNFKNFSTGFQTEKTGCKGIGRINYLKVFEKAEITSVYKECNGLLKRRIFEFSFSNDLMKSDSFKLENVENNEELRTVVYLKNAYQDYAKFSGKNINDIYNMLQEHFYPMLRTFFVSGLKIKIRILDGTEEKIISNSDFKADLEKKEKLIINYNDKDYIFEISHIKTKFNKNNMIYFCAGNRVVKSEEILDLRKKSIGNDFYYNEYVSSSYLEDNVVFNRSTFLIDEKDSLELSWEEMQKRITENRKSYLEDVYSSIEKDLNNSCDEFFKNNPEYHYIKEQNKENLEKIPYSIDKNRIPEYIRKIHEQNIDNTRKEAYKFLDKLSKETSEKINKEELETFINRLTVKQSTEGIVELSGYINYRKWILELLDKSIKLNSDNKYEKERILHDLLAPKGSYAINSNDHNLWLLDDKLSLYEYLNSEKQSIDKSIDRPDIICYGEKIETLKKNSLTIIELKRPGRDDTGSVDQVLGYIDKIQEYGYKDASGRTINVDSNTLFFCYIVQDIEEIDRKNIKYRGFRETGIGTYYLRPENYKTTVIELISYDALLEIAKKRNNLFFEKLRIKDM